MFSQILSVTLCLILLLPAGSAAENPRQLSQSEEIQNATSVVPEPASPQPLSQEEEASLSARAEEPGPEVSGGALSNLHLTYVVIALAAVVLVMLIK